MKTVLRICCLLYMVYNLQLPLVQGTGAGFIAKDTLFLLDASLTIDKDRFYNELLDFTNRFVAQVPGDSQAGLITFSKEVIEQIPFGSYSAEAWSDAVEVIREEQNACCSLGTPIAEALELATSILNENGLNEKQTVMMFTDGEPYQIETGEYRARNTRSDEERYLLNIVPGAAQKLKDAGVRLIVYAVPGTRLRDGKSTIPYVDYFSGNDTIVGDEGNTKVCVNLTRIDGGRSCFRSDVFPVVSEPIGSNLFAVNNWEDFFNLTILSCETFDACPPTSSPSASPPSVSRPTITPTMFTTPAPINGGATVAPTTTSTTNGSDISCSDGLRNGNETGTDCGGGTCPGCIHGGRCRADTDCLDILVCLRRGDSYSICIEPNCTDSAINAMETDVDCGGPECPGCNMGQSCNTTDDCLDGLECIDDICSAISERRTATPASVIGVIATIVVLSGYAVVSVLTGTVTAGNAANYLSAQGNTAFGEVSSVFTMYEFLSLAQYTAVGATMNLPGVPDNYFSFSTSMGITFLNFIPVGPSPTDDGDDKSERRLQTTETDAMAQYAAEWNLEPPFLLPSVCIGFLLCFFTIIILYLISYKLQVVVAERLLKHKLVKKPRPLTSNKMLQVAKEALVRLIYYLAFPIAVVLSYHFRLAAVETYNNQQRPTTIGFTVVAALVVPLLMMSFIIGFKRTKDYPRVEINMIQAGSKRSIAQDKLGGELDKEEVIAKQLGPKIIYRCLAADWKYECRLFWIIRVVFDVLRGIALGVFVTGEPRPIQAILYVTVAVLYGVAMLYVQPYETELQNLTGLFIAVAYIPSTVLLLLFSMEPRPYLPENEDALGALAIALQVMGLLGMVVLVLYNYLRSLKDWVEKKHQQYLEEKRKKLNQQRKEAPTNVEKVVLDEPGEVLNTVVENT